MTERLLLNLLLSLTPVFIFQLFMLSSIFERDSRIVQGFIGTVSGIACVLCMVYPIVTGFGFLWDLRWVPFVISVIYGSLPGGLICAAFMLTYRAYLGGFLSWCIVAADVVVLTAAMMRYRKYLRTRHTPNFVLIHVIISSASYIFVVGSIYLYFILIHSTVSFLQHGLGFFATYGLLTVVAHVLSVLVIESLFKQSDLKKEMNLAERRVLLYDLAASIAHEIRNPLTVAKGFLQLTSESISGKTQTYVEMAESELDRAESVIGEYLSLARDYPDSPEILSVAVECQSIGALTSPYASLYQTDMRWDCDPDVRILGNRQQFRQLMMNLIKNSIEAMPNGGKLYIGVSKQADMARITIRDQGIGMTKDELNRLGTPFYSTKTKGTGLGLMVCFRIVDALSGNMRFDSDVKSGTLVTITLPLYAMEQTLEEA